jgi:hypothetical protein
MELSPSMCSWLVETADSFHGAQRRRFMAQTVEALDLSQRRAALFLGWARDTVRKGLHELHSGITCWDNFSARGRKPRLSSLCCFSMLEFMPESVPSRRVFQVGMQ